MGRIIVIGCNNPDHDFQVLEHIADWMTNHGHPDWATKLVTNDLDHYDMSTRPEKGDAVVAIQQADDVELVIALHLFYHDKPKWLTDSSYYYSEQNTFLLDTCFNKGVPLVAWGDQPIIWRGSMYLFGYQRKTRIGPSCYMYEYDASMKPIRFQVSLDGDEISVNQL